MTSKGILRHALNNEMSRNKNHSEKLSVFFIVSSFLVFFVIRFATPFTSFFWAIMMFFLPLLLIIVGFFLQILSHLHTKTKNSKHP